MKPLDLLERAKAARAEVLALIAAWRSSVGAGPDAPPPAELAACLMVAEEEEDAAEAWASGDYEPDAEPLEERRALCEAYRDEGWPTDDGAPSAPAGGHYGDA